MNNNLKGFTFGIATSVTFGLIPLFTLPLFNNGMQLDSILFYRFAFATIALFLMLTSKKVSLRPQIKDLPILTLLGTFYTGSALFLFWGYTFMSAGIATTIHFTYPIFVTLIMLFFFKEKASWITILSIILAISGVARLSIEKGEFHLDTIGVIIVLLSAICYGLYIVVVNKSRAHDMPGRKLTFYVFIISTCLFFIKAQTNTGIQPIPNLTSFVNIILLAIVPTVISNITLVQAVRHIGSTLTAVLGAMEPVTAVIVGVLIFSEPLTPQLAFGICLIIIAVTLVILSKHITQSINKFRRTIKR